MKLCEFVNEENKGIYNIGVCTITGNPCSFYRYCVTYKCIQMTPYFYKYGCKMRNKKMEESE